MVMVDSELDSGLKTATGALLSFCKMQALGNDFVVVSEEELDCAASGVKSPGLLNSSMILSKLAQKLCSRHFGIGADGFIVVRRSSNSQRLAWNYLNSDGSVSLMCGNGLRCLALFAEENKMAPAREYEVETGKGAVRIVFNSPDSITTDLGEPVLNPSAVPLAEESDNPVIAREFCIGKDKIKATCLSMGNPHCVVFTEKLDSPALEEFACALQSNPFFPEGVNVEFAKIENERLVKVIVYERGCGRTLACASGAAAVVAAGVLEGRSSRNMEVELEGGKLQISWSEKDGHLRVTGPASTVFRGSINLNSLYPEALS